MQIPVTQFADTCKIPRPTLSQLLNGRNKKVSDELITKIHEAYPQLSVMWLMFGEGDMLTVENIEISEPKNTNLFDFNEAEDADTVPNTNQLEFENPVTDDAANSFAPQQSEPLSVNSLPEEVNSLQLGNLVREKKNTVSFDTTSTKKIVNIIIYYNDNSFESFVPSPEK